MLVHKGSVYRLALTPQQKELKKDYLLQQYLADPNEIPSWDEVWEKDIQYSDGLTYLLEELDETKEPIDEDDVEEAAERLIPETVYLSYQDLFYLEDETEQKQVEQEYDAAMEAARPVALEKLQAEREAELEEEAKDQLEYRYNEVVQLFKQELHGQDCWRAIRTNADPTKLTGLGIYWSYAEEGADAYDGGEGKYVQFRAKIDMKYVNKPESIFLNMDPSIGELEKEIRFFPHSPIYVYDMEVQQANGQTKIIPINDWRRC